MHLLKKLWVFPALRVFEAMETSGTTDLRNPETPRQSARWSSQVSTNLFEGNHFELKFTVIEKLWQCHQYIFYSTPALLEWLHQLGCVGLIPFSNFYRLLTLFDVSVMVMFDEWEDRSMCLGPIFFPQQGPHQVFKNPTLFPGQWLVKQGSARASGRQGCIIWAEFVQTRVVHFVAWVKNPNDQSLWRTNWTQIWPNDATLHPMSCCAAWGNS